MAKPPKLLRPSTGFAERLLEATDARAVAGVLREVGKAGVPHSALQPLVGNGPPGYRYDPELRRYMREKTAKVAGEVAVSATHREQAAEAYRLIRPEYATRTNKQLASWRPVQVEGGGRLPASPNGVESYLKQAKTPETRAMLARNVLMLTSGLLADGRPNGHWAEAPNGNLRAAAAAEVLLKPFGKGEPTVAPSVPVAWEQVDLNNFGGGTVMRRRETVLDAVHPPALVVKRGSDEVAGRVSLGRHYTLTQDTFVVVHPDLVVGSDIETSDLEEAVASHGSGFDDLVVPAAGFVALQQQLWLPAN